MPTLGTTPLNPAAGGANVVTDQQSSGAQMPISELAYSADGVVDSKPVTGANPLPVGGINPATGAALSPSVVPSGGVTEQAVYDARAATARDALQISMQAVVDALTTSVLQVAAALVGQGVVGMAPPDGKALTVQGAVGGVTMPTAITSPGGGAATVMPYGYLRVQTEPVQVFYDAFDGLSLDTTNRWNAPVSGNGGSATYAQTTLTLSTGTAANGFAYITSRPTFQPVAPGFLVQSDFVQIEATPQIQNSYRFWGRGTVPTVPSAAAPLIDGFGWERYTDGALYAVCYAGGNRNVILSLRNVQPNDGAVHKFLTQFRGDIAYWSIDTLDNVVATMPTGAQGPNNNVLPLAFLAIAGATPPTSSASLNVAQTNVGDSTNAPGISDPVYSFVSPNVKQASTAAVASDAALVVAPSPNSPTQAQAPSGAVKPVPVVQSGQAVPVIATEIERLLRAIVVRLDALLWVQENATGQQLSANDPARVPVQ